MIEEGISSVSNFERSLYRFRCVLRSGRSDLSMSIMYTGDGSAESMSAKDEMVVYINASNSTRP